MLHIHRVDCDELTLQIINEKFKIKQRCQIHIIE